METESSAHALKGDVRQLQPTTDINAAVKFHVLCEVCKVLSARTKDICLADVLRPNITFKHHPSIAQLQASAVNGCHLCSLLWDRLDRSDINEKGDSESESHTSEAQNPDLGTAGYDLQCFKDGVMIDLVVRVEFSTDARLSPSTPHHGQSKKLLYLIVYRHTSLPLPYCPHKHYSDT